VEKRAGVEARLVTDEVLTLPPAVEEALYAIAVEALNNALKHASATTVTVKLHAGESRIHMEVIDNGRGFEPLRVKESWGMGLKNMRARVEHLNGKLDISSTPGAGTHVKVEVAI
jgi:signal transduction histidine kinase